MNITQTENVKKPLRNIYDAYKSVLMEELVNIAVKFIHGMLSVTGPFDTDSITCLQEIYNDDSRGRCHSLKSRKIFLIVYDRHHVDFTTELSNRLKLQNYQGLGN